MSGTCWLTIPSARPAAEVEPVLQKWRAQGYKIALCVDNAADAKAKNDMANIIISSPEGYRGYAKSVNALIAMIISEKTMEAEWFIAAGDDTFPDPNHTAEEIALECWHHFLQPSDDSRDATFGVMQPTGHRWGENEPWARAKYPGRPAYIDRICGSAWIGREFARRIYGGKGPFWPEFSHMFLDEHLQCVAEKLGVFWQRRDLIHYHNHWGLDGDARKMPEFLRKVNTSEHWKESQAIFERLKAGGFAEANDLLP